MTNIYRLMEENGIEYEKHDHPPVYTVADVRRLIPDLPGAKTKNLFLRAKKEKRLFMVVVPDDKRVDLKLLPRSLGCHRISFGSPKRLMRYLGVEPGSVSLLAIANDTDNAVEVFVDSALWSSAAFQFHPLINTSTLVITKNGIERFLAVTGHDATVIDIPGQES